jgi:hypothetical protein
MKDSFIHNDMPEDLPAFVKLCQKWDNQIGPWKAEKAAHHQWVGHTVSAASPRVPAPLKTPKAAPAGNVARYTGPAPMDHGAGRRRISDEKRPKWFVDGRSLYCGWLNHRAVECAVRKKGWTFKVAGSEVKGVDDSEATGKERVD